MTNSATALYNFASSFEWKAYAEGGVPASAELPYITYTVQNYDWDSMGMLQMRLWYRGADYKTINKKIDDIEARIENGSRIMTPEGMLVIYKGSPWCQYELTQEVDLKVAYLNFDVHYLTN